MPLRIIRQDITKIECDAIVNPTNRGLTPNGGTDAAIHEAAGPQLALACSAIGPISVGEAVITPAFDLPCKYVIHTVGPQWHSGFEGERILLRSCYGACLELAVSHGCRSVAFPLIASGLYGYPKDRVLREATQVIGRFLDGHELEVYIVVYDKEAYTVSSELFNEVTAYIDDNYIGAITPSFSCAPPPRRSIESVIEAKQSLRRRRGSEVLDEYLKATNVPRHEAAERREESIQKCDTLCDEFSVADYSESEERDGFMLMCSEPEPVKASYSSRRLGDMLDNMDKGFTETLLGYIDAKGISDVEAYKRSNVSRKTFSKIRCTKDYRPSKITAVSFAIGLRLNLRETEHLLQTAGMCLSKSLVFDLIIEYFIISGKYETIFDVNELLYKMDQPLLGV